MSADGSTGDIEFYESGRASLDEVIRRTRREALKPPPKLTVSQWAERYGQLSRETSAQTGSFVAFAYQRGILDALGDPANALVTAMKSARVGWTKSLDLAVGFYLHQDPSPILVVQPRVEDAEDYSKTEITPMLRDTPVLAEISPERTKDGDNTVLAKTFKNGAVLRLVGANSPGGFRRITVRCVFFDEVDGYPIEGAGSEGDQISLGVGRTLTFWNRRIALGSTPTIRGFSRIEKSFDESDQRHYYVPCPHCGEHQRLEWGGPDTPFGFKWDRDKDGNGVPETVFYLCRHNGCVIREIDKPKMVESGEWRAMKPFKGHAGFHIWAAYSLFPNAAWSKLVEEWLLAKGNPLKRQTFYNLVLGLPYEDFGEGSIRKEDVHARCHDWPGEVPAEAVVLTAGVDVQDHRVEVEIVAWSDTEESWSVDYSVFEGDIESDKFWREFDLKHLLRKWKKPDGTAMPLTAVCVDSGGHHTQKVYDFCKARLARKVFAIKGESARGGRRSPVWPTARPVRRRKNAFRPVILGVNAAKDTIRSRLHLEVPGAGYMHFPTGRGENYFAQLTAERLVAKIVDGFRFRVWELPEGRANEALDARVYSYAALCSLKQFGFKIGEKLIGARPVEDHSEHEPVPVDESKTQTPAVIAKPIAQAAVSVTVGLGTKGEAESPAARRARVLKMLA